MRVIRSEVSVGFLFSESQLQSPMRLLTIGLIYLTDINVLCARCSFGSIPLSTDLKGVSRSSFRLSCARQGTLTLTWGFVYMGGDKLRRRHSILHCYPFSYSGFQRNHACQSVSRSVLSDTTISHRHIAPTSKSCPATKTRLAGYGNGTPTSGDVHDVGRCPSGSGTIVLNAGPSNAGCSNDQRFG